MAMQERIEELHLQDSNTTSSRTVEPAYSRGRPIHRLHRYLSHTSKGNLQQPHTLLRYLGCEYSRVHLHLVQPLQYQPRVAVF